MTHISNWQVVHQRSQGLPRNLRELNFSLQLLSILRRLGWHRSVSRKACTDCEGDPLPWYTYPAIDWLANRVKPSDRVFEFGGGYSTLWFSRRVHTVVTVEHNQAWFNRLQQLVGANVTLLLSPSSGDEVKSKGQSEYLRPIEQYPQRGFDVIAIDGVERVSCVFAAVARLREDGIMIFDNSDRPIYREGIEYLRQAGFGRIDFYGFVPGCGTRGCTSVFGRFVSRWTSAEAPLIDQGY